MSTPPPLPEKKPHVVGQLGRSALRVIEVVAVCAGVTAFFMDMSNKKDERIRSAWNLVYTSAGNGGEGMADALEFLNKNGKSLRSMNLSGAHLQQTDLTGARLGRANLEGATLHDTNLTGADLMEANLSHTDIYNTTFLAELFNANFDGTFMREVDLQGHSIAGARFREARLINIWFNESKLAGSDFRDATLLGVDFSGASLAGAVFEKAHAPQANFHGANLQEANFKDANLAEANFTGADLNKADFTGADVTGAVFVNVTGDEALLQDLRRRTSQTP